MIKLLRPSPEETDYWEVWQDEESLIIHGGTIGERGEWTRVQIRTGQDPNQLMSELSSGATQRGFRLVAEDDFTDVTLQYQVEGFGFVTDVERRYKIQSFLNEALGWTGNGHCDGGDIGSGTMNIFCRVFDVEKAAVTILDELHKYNLLQGAVLVDDGEEAVTVIYPSGGSYRVG